MVQGVWLFPFVVATTRRTTRAVAEIRYAHTGLRRAHQPRVGSGGHASGGSLSLSRSSLAARLFPFLRPADSSLRFFLWLGFLSCCGALVRGKQPCALRCVFGFECLLSSACVASTRSRDLGELLFCTTMQGKEERCKGEEEGSEREERSLGGAYIPIERESDEPRPGKILGPVSCAETSRKSFVRIPGLHRSHRRLRTR